MNNSPEQRGETLPPAENGGESCIQCGNDPGQCACEPKGRNNPVMKKLEEIPHHLRPTMPVPGDNWTEDDAQYLIAELRVLIWKFGPRNMVLEDAEAVAQHCWTSIRDGKPWI